MSVNENPFVVRDIIQAAINAPSRLNVWLTFREIRAPVLQRSVTIDRLYLQEVKFDSHNKLQENNKVNMK